ncbi:Multidrug export protein EmrB [compost metagenome]
MAYRSKITLVYLLGFALDLLNMFASNIALPNIALELHASVTQLAWISNAYMLGLTLIIPLSVWLAARVGERRLILGSLMVFGSASWLAAQAASIEALIGWRLLQGLGGGLLIPVGQALAYRHFPAAERSHLTAMVMLVALLVPALSPAAGGLVVQTLSWRQSPDRHGDAGRPVRSGTVACGRRAGGADTVLALDLLRQPTAGVADVGARDLLAENRRAITAAHHAGRSRSSVGCYDHQPVAGCIEPVERKRTAHCGLGDVGTQCRAGMAVCT